METQRLSSKVAGTLRVLEEKSGRILFTLDEGVIRKNTADKWQRVRLPVISTFEKRLSFKGELPLSAGPKDSQLYLKFGFNNAEGLLFLEGKPYWGIDRNHSLVPLPITCRGRPLLNKKILTFEVEWSFSNRICSAPDQPHLFSSVELSALNHQILKFYYHLRVIFEIWQTAEEKEKKVLEPVILKALRKFDAGTPMSDWGEEMNSITEACGILTREFFAKKGLSHNPAPVCLPLHAVGRGSKQGFSLALVGHSHIDTAWLWTIAETIRKCGRTFSTALRLMEIYPEFIFCASQPQLYQFTKKYYPDVYQGIKERVAKGQWEPVGGLWVEPDCNLISGESLVRQILYGKKFFKEEFGKDVRTAWLPDTFGFSGSLPQIFKESGIDYFYTNKIYWQTTNRFPHSLFWWQGIDGSRVLAHTPKLFWGYNGFPNPYQFKKAEKEFQQKIRFPVCLFPFGYGDGGGGVSLEMLEYAKRVGNLPYLPKSSASRVEDYFKKVVKESKDLPVWKGELYLETHQGCYTSQAQIKQNNRTAENLLYTLELLQSLNTILGGLDKSSPCQSYDKGNPPYKQGVGGGFIRPEEMTDIWEKILTFQFHDILPGSSIKEVYQDIEPQYQKIIMHLNDEIKNNLNKIAGRISVSPEKGEAVLLFNPLNWERKEIVEVKPGILINTALPSCGYRVYYLKGEKPEKSELKIKKDFLENKNLSLNLNQQGRIISIYDKVNKKEVIPPKSCANDFLIFKDGPLAEEAWNIDPDYESTVRPFGKLVQRKIIESCPFRAVLRQVFKDNKSTLSQDIVLYEDSWRIDFKTTVNWQERRKMLKSAFPVSVKSDQAFYEIPFGAIGRPTTNNNSWEEAKKEVSALRWADLSDDKYGVSLLNDCKYGYDIKRNIIRLTLLRAPTYPDPEADWGKHRFTYSLFLHRGNWSNSEVVKQGYQLNIPVLLLPLSVGAPFMAPETGLMNQAPTSFSFIKTEGLDVVISALKRSEDGQGFILRLYESNGKAGKVTVTLPSEPKELRETNLIEEVKNKIPFTGRRFTIMVKPFQIATFFYQPQ
ncbi:MAG: alpha-mannosidase [Candidatus Omnitrophota bacterium]